MARRSRRNQVNIWPGFVDALTTLVMVVIFVLVVFIFAQQFLSTQLNDNVTQIRSLENENEQLEFEKFELQERNMRLGNELDAMRLELATLRGERNILRDNLSTTRSEVQSLANQLAQMPTYALGLTKKALHTSAFNSLEQQLGLELELQFEAAETKDYAEGVQAFLEKRPANFLGR